MKCRFELLNQQTEVVAAGEASHLGKKSLPSSAVTRGSTDTNAIDDPFVASVAGYIRRHASDGIDVFGSID